MQYTVQSYMYTNLNFLLQLMLTLTIMISKVPKITTPAIIIPTSAPVLRPSSSPPLLGELCDAVTEDYTQLFKNSVALFFLQNINFVSIPSIRSL